MGKAHQDLFIMRVDGSNALKIATPIAEEGKILQMKKTNAPMKATATILSCLALVLVLALSGAAAAAPEVTLRFAGQSVEEHIATGFMREVADEVARHTGGRIEIKVYPDNQLADYALVHQELMKGTIDMALISTPGDIDPRLSFVYINGYCTDYDQLQETFKPGGWAFHKMDELNTELGVKFLGFGVIGFIGVASTKPLIEPLDPGVDKGVVCRVPNMPPFLEAARTLGYRPVNIPYSGLYTAMTAGDAEAITGLPVSDAYANLREAAKHWYQFNLSVEVESYLVSMKTWEKLSPEDRKLIGDVVATVSAKSFYAAKWGDERYQEMMRERGAEVHIYSDAELEPLRKAARETWPKLANSMTEAFMEEFTREYAPK